MRVKKLLPLILLAVGAVFLLSSCDAILDAIYANNTLTVNVGVPITYPFDNSPYSYVVVTLSGASGGQESAYFYGTSGPYAYYYPPEFKKLPNGNYTVTVDYYANGYSPQYATTVTSLSMPYAGSNTATVDIYFP